MSSYFMFIVSAFFAEIFVHLSESCLIYGKPHRHNLGIRV
ncbi:hypothetical protein BIW11_03906 [Tropilaelaps mercedesae]|uniref:Uncharacterized protein n=1 Tax=Tropilaelaps mercedesae TaxID=418985 RepID=A0A1V9XDY6_9ACAR|nr:hypothetical protein BIW11_03906 [Tropilaelaps mercedesae]